MAWQHSRQAIICVSCHICITVLCTSCRTTQYARCHLIGTPRFCGVFATIFVASVTRPSLKLIKRRWGLGTRLVHVLRCIHQFSIHCELHVCVQGSLTVIYCQLVTVSCDVIFSTLVGSSSPLGVSSLNCSPKDKMKHNNYRYFHGTQNCHSMHCTHFISLSLVLSLVSTNRWLL